MNYLEFLKTAAADETQAIEALRSEVKTMTDVNEISKANELLEVRRSNLAKFNEGIALIAAEVNKNVDSLFDAKADANIEYRMAQMEYIANGKMSDILTRASTNVSDSAIIINETLYNKIITKAKSYGSISSMAKKLHVKGGIKIGRGFDKATVTWGNDTLVVESQALKALGTISFVANQCRLSVSRTELHYLGYVIDAWEDKLAEAVAEAMAQALDYVEFNGDPDANQPLGILNDPDVNNIREFTEESFNNYINHRGLTVGLNVKYQKGVYVMTASTFEDLTKVQNGTSNVFAAGVTTTANGQKNTYDGKDVILVENDILKSWSECEAGDCFIVYLNPEDYWFNLQEDVIVDTYQDKKTREMITDVVMYIDGRIADPFGVIKFIKAA
jgi:HK97 family phage major capsid protein